MAVKEKAKMIVLSVAGLALVAGYGLFLRSNSGNCAIPGGALNPSPAMLFAAADSSGEATGPAWEVETLGGETITHSDRAGKVTVVNFWATWCPPCRKSIPVYQDLQNEYREQGFAVVGLSVDQGGTEIVQRFLDQREVTYPVGLATTEHEQAFGSVTMIPTTFVLDQAGKVRYRNVGLADEGKLRKEIEGLLNEAS